MDRVRQQTIPKEGTTLDYLGLSFYVVLYILRLTRNFLSLDEAFTSENWIVS